MSSAPEQHASYHGHGLLTTNLAVTFFGLAGVLGKLSALPSPLIVLGRVVFAGLALTLAAKLRHVALRPRSRRDLGILLGQGVLLAIHWTAFFQAINVSNVAIGLLAFSCFPLFTTALEPLLLRQPPSRLQAVCALFVLPGIYLLAPGFQLSSATTRGILWGLFAGATFALLSVTNRWLGRRYESLTISLYQEATAAAVLLPTLAFFPLHLLASWRELAILLVLGICCTALAHTLFISGMRDITAQLASLFGSLEPVWGILFALVLLHEIPSGHTLIGGAIILSATLLPTALALRAHRAALRTSSSAPPATAYSALSSASRSGALSDDDTGT